MPKLVEYGIKQDERISEVHEQSLTIRHAKLSRLVSILVNDVSLTNEDTNLI